MPNKMLIDASHPEETRVVVTRGNRIEEFDFESQDKKQLRGNIYLARVTRVEPSLQAAFVEYGGNRHGFLAFNEIHPDYYQIPVADRQALLRAEEEEARAEDDDEQAEEDRVRSGGKRRGRGRGRGRKDAPTADDPASGDDAGIVAETDAAEGSHASSDAEEVGEAEARNSLEEALPEAVIAEAVEADVVSEAVEADDDVSDDRDHDDENHDDNADHDDNGVTSVGAEDALEEARPRRRAPRRQYKIQEVIKRRQILLVQVVKEERGNKGAALTTYLSLAGRYSVLMPNTARGGGISRKITNAQDRKRLKDVVKDLDVPQGMGVILRTAGENRTKAEIKRDYEYLMRLWENVRGLTLQSTAPALVYEEGSLIKRSVRDLYNKDIDEILVSGEDGYREAKDFMRMLMPSHAKVVQPYRDPVPIFARQGIEAQLDRMLQPQVTLKSGGYIIINQTEALVAIDVNSGRSTREHSIEDTALQTNLEAADEVARQLRLRDMAGLIVIDFIDMEENRNNRAVEKKLKDCLKNDRARIQVGRISHFGLMEMSRQRIRASVLESTMKPCPHCGGTGHIRSDSSVALHVIRAIEEHLLKDARHHITVRTPAATALYVLNHKRANLVELENRFGLTISMEADETLGPQLYSIIKGAVAEHRDIDLTPLPTPAFEAMEDEEVEDSGGEAEADEAASGQHANDEGGHRDGRRRRRKRRRGRDHSADTGNVVNAASDLDSSLPSEPALLSDEKEDADAADAVEARQGGEPKKRRRGKRGGRRNRPEHESDQGEAADTADDAFAEAGEYGTVASETPLSDGPHEGETDEVEANATQAVAEQAKPAAKPRRRSRKKAEAEDVAAVQEADGAASPTAQVASDEGEPVEPAPEAEPEEASEPVQAPEEKEPVTPVVTSSGEQENAARPRKTGWWQRKGFF